MTYHVGAAVDQRGQVERRALLVVAQVGVGARGEQQLHHLEVAGPTGGWSNNNQVPPVITDRF